MTGLLVVLMTTLIVVVWVTAIYNQLVTLRNRFKNAFAQIEVQLKRRYDLIPNLVETAKGYIKHERETLEAVTNARNAAAAGLTHAARDPGDANAMANLADQEKALGGALARFNMTMEAYPDLKANQNMLQLSEELSSTENRISSARGTFNDAVMSYNTYKQSFPAVLLAATFGHAKDAQLLEFEDRQEIQSAPKLSF